MGTTGVEIGLSIVHIRGSFGNPSPAVGCVGLQGVSEVFFEELGPPMFVFGRTYVNPTDPTGISGAGNRHCR
jgi:hypothetical protein